MKIEIDSNSGFCFGVVKAIKKAEQELHTAKPLYCLGDIVHNSSELERLSSKGLITINHDEFKQLKNVKVLIRAHGEPPETYKIAKENNIKLIDATCPVVIRLQQKISKGYQFSKSNNTQILIFGKEGHAEVNGLVGQTENTATVINNEDDISKIDTGRPVIMFSQTTQDIEKYHEISSKIKDKLQEDCEMEAFDTICRQVSNRAIELKIFARNHDIIIFVSGKKSSNGKVLYEICLHENSRTYFVSVPEELNPDWFKNARTVGICGATSTPMWLMEKMAKIISTYL